jgi:hypothetical protein
MEPVQTLWTPPTRPTQLHGGTDFMDTTFTGKISSFRPSEKGAEVDFQDCTPEDVAQLADRFLGAIGLNLEDGTVMQGVYGSGSKAGRAIGGGFVKRRKYVVSVSVTEGGVRLSMVSGMSGLSGSVVGLMRERKQRKEFVASLTSFLGWQPKI